MLAGQWTRRLRGAPMTSFDWTVLRGSLAAGLGVVLIAMTALSRRKTRRPAEVAQVAPGSKRRRIDVVAIDEGAGRAQERERHP